MIKFLKILLLLIPQRYEFSSKSQLTTLLIHIKISCCWYHKGTNFQANHNLYFHGVDFLQLLLIPQRYEFSSKSQPAGTGQALGSRCCWYHKGTNFQANHNTMHAWISFPWVVADTTKVRIFKQITTKTKWVTWWASCCWYHKGTNFQANHN